ncbi:MAG: efflux RND transporter periplasmic adaptor subunit [Cyclobacteriaceae bacterium]|nr:efflux RND transporter periplasmic adaptor subunit [Cyclobacteriaceae bacterium]
MNRKILMGIGAVVILLIGYFVVRGGGNNDTADILVSVERGKFQVDVETTGELEAKNSVKIYGPRKLREHRIFQVKIDKIVEEGTEVEKGGWIASLDRSDLMTKMQDAQLEVDKELSQYTQIELDTTLQMRQSRDELINLQYAIEEKQIILDQSKFEPPATIKQNEINFKKAERAYTQAKENYIIKKKQNKARMQEVNANLRKSQNKLKSLTDLMMEFNIIAPEDGMLIYKKGFDGKPMKEGSTISAWDPVVATLPDLSVMISKTFVNEVDVRKIKKGQVVEVGLDAFPDKRLNGRVIKVANVGEQRPNSDAKVFQVNIQIEGRDGLLRPSMTTSNKIIISTLDTANFVAMECLHSKNDSITYVFLKDGLSVKKQEVEIGLNNMNEVVIINGVAEGDRLYLSIPSGYEDEEISLLASLNGKRNLKKVEEKVEKQGPPQRGKRMRGQGESGGGKRSSKKESIK